MRQERNPEMGDGKVELPSLSKREALVVAGAGLLSVLTGCKVVGTPGETGQTSATATTEFLPTASPEVILAIEKSAQTAIDQGFSGLGIHEPKVVGGPLKDALGTEFALFKTQLPDKKGGRDLEFLMLGQVNGQNSVENIKGLVVDENAPKSDIVDFLGVTYDSANAIFSLEGPFARTNVKTGEIEIFRQGVWVPLLAPVPTMDAVKKEVALGVLAAPALPTPTTEPTATPTEAPTPTEIPIKVGLPERFEDIQVIKEENLDTFMPRLLAAEREYVAQHPEMFKYQRINISSRPEWEFLPIMRQSTPYNAWPFDADNYDEEAKKSIPVSVSSWTLIQMADGTKIYMVGIPGRLYHGGTINNDFFGPYILHFAVNPAAFEESLKRDGADLDFYHKNSSPEANFSHAQMGYAEFTAGLFIDSNSPNQEVVAAEGWQDSGALLKKIDDGFGFSKGLKDWAYKHITPNETYFKSLEVSVLPCRFAGYVTTKGPLPK